MRIAGALFRAAGTGATRLARREHVCVRADRMPSVRACAAVHRDHRNARCRRNMRRAGVDGQKQVCAPKKRGKVAKPRLAAKIRHWFLYRRNDFVCIRAVAWCAYDKKSGIVPLGKRLHGRGEIFLRPCLQRKRALDAKGNPLLRARQTLQQATFCS